METRFKVLSGWWQVTVFLLLFDWITLQMEIWSCKHPWPVIYQVLIACKSKEVFLLQFSRQIILLRETVLIQLHSLKPLLKSRGYRKWPSMQFWEPFIRPKEEALTDLRIFWWPKMLSEEELRKMPQTSAPGHCVHDLPLFDCIHLVRPLPYPEALLHWKPMQRMGARMKSVWEEREFIQRVALLVQFARAFFSLQLGAFEGITKGGILSWTTLLPQAFRVPSNGKVLPLLFHAGHCSVIPFRNIQFPTAGT